MRRMRAWTRGGAGAALIVAALVAATGLAPALPGAAEVRAQSVDELVARGAEAGADAALMAELRDRAAAAGLDAAATARLLAPAVTLAESGLPSGAVLQKGLEGLSKRVPAPRIAAVQGELRAAVERAGPIVDAWLSEPGVRERLEASGAASAAGGAAADGVRAAVVEGTGMALAQGAPEPAVRALLDRVPAEVGRARVEALEVAVAVEVLADLPLAAGRPALAAEVVAAALDGGFGPAELRELPAALQAAERRGEVPAEAVARGAIEGMGDLPARAVLEALFEGGLPGAAPFDVPPGLERAREQLGGPPGDDQP